MLFNRPELTWTYYGSPFTQWHKKGNCNFFLIARYKLVIIWRKFDEVNAKFWEKKNHFLKKTKLQDVNFKLWCDLELWEEVRILSFIFLLILRSVATTFLIWIILVHGRNRHNFIWIHFHDLEINTNKCFRHIFHC